MGVLLMFEVEMYTGDRAQDYATVRSQLMALIDGETDIVANLANASALLNHYLQNINWVGFYLWKEDELVLGPFQGLPACIRIPAGKGVCGTSIEEERTLRVADVEQFPGHIACDAASQSEIVIPMIVNGEKFGVLDIDSPVKNRFDEVDERELEQFVTILTTRFAQIIE